jgi:uncharacterized protein
MKSSVPLLGQVNTIINNQKITFLLQKALWLEEESMLLLADTHLGKARHFRKGGIPIPDTIHDTDFSVLYGLIFNLHAKKVIFLGDLFHSDWNLHWQSFENFMNEFPEVEFELIKGNHDILKEEVYRESQLKVHASPLQIGELLLSHEPLESGELTNICGHVHPGIRLIGRARQSLRFPCFYQTKGRIILPAFGRFTGTMEINHYGEGTAYAVVNRKLHPINLRQRLV